MLTVFAFDTDVWIRDIDSSPSPFPIPIILEFLRPHHLGWCRRGRRDFQAVQPAHDICSLECNCPVKLRQSPEPEPRFPGGEGRYQLSLPRALVRLPDAAEQRASIAVSFELFNERGNFASQITS